MCLGPSNNNDNKNNMLFKIKLLQQEQCNTFLILANLLYAKYGVSIMKLLSGYSVLAGGAYKECHDKVAINLHWHLCGKYDCYDLSFGEITPPPAVKSFRISIFLQTT